MEPTVLPVRDCVKIISCQASIEEKLAENERGAGKRNERIAYCHDSMPGARGMHSGFRECDNERCSIVTSFSICGMRRRRKPMR